MWQGRRFRQFSGCFRTGPRELRGRRRRIGSGREFPTSGAFRTARLIAVLGKCPFGAGSRGPSSASIFPPQPDFSRQFSGCTRQIAYSLLATLPKSTPPAESQIRRGSSVSRGVLLSRGGVFQAGIVLGPLIFDSSRKCPRPTPPRVRFPPVLAKVPRLSSLGGGFGPDSDLPSFA